MKQDLSEKKLENLEKTLTEDLEATTKEETVTQETITIAAGISIVENLQTNFFDLRKEAK